MTTPRARTAHQTRLVAGKITRKLAKPHGNYNHSQLMWGVVHAVNGIDGVDPKGNPIPNTVNVLLSGSQNSNDPSVNNQVTYGLKFLSTYVPSVGDGVRVIRGHGRTRGSKFVLGKAASAASPFGLALGSLAENGRWIQSGAQIWGGPGVPTIPEADPSLNPPTLGATNGDWFLQTDAPIGWVMVNGAWVSTIGLSTVTENATTGVFTLLLADFGTTIEFTTTIVEDITVLIPLNADVPFPAQTEIDLVQIGTAVVNVAGASGVTIQSPSGLYAVKSQYGTVTLRYRGSDTWILSGDV